MAGLLSQVFGGGAVTAPTLPTYNPQSAETGFLAQNFGAAENQSNAMTSGTSAANLSSFTSGLDTVDPGALSGMNAEQTLGNTLLSGSMGALPSWAQQYLNVGQEQGAENAASRGVGAFSQNGQSGMNQFMGRNAMNLVNMGAGFANTAFGESTGIVNATKYQANPMDFLLTPGQFQQAGEFNTQIGDQQAQDNAAASNYNSNNSPAGAAIRTGLSDLVYLAGAYLSKGGAGNVPSQSSSTSSSYDGGGSGGGGIGSGSGGISMGMFGGG